MRTTILAGMIGIIGIGVADIALAQQGQGESPWMIRARAVNLGMENKSDAGSGGLTPALLPTDSIKASNKTIPEVDISYFFTKNFALELILTVPQKHTVKISQGPLAESIGSFKHLPPTLTAQYHFNPEGQFRPYVGAGINFTKISGVKLRSNIAGADLTLDGSSTGAALQAGFDIPINKNLSFNFDVKKIYIDTDVKVGGQKSSHLNLNPLAVGVGLGWRF